MAEVEQMSPVTDITAKGIDEVNAKTATLNAMARGLVSEIELSHLAEDGMHSAATVCKAAGQESLSKQCENAAAAVGTCGKILACVREQKISATSAVVAAG